MKTQISLIIFCLLNLSATSFGASIPKLGDIVTNSDGTTHLMWHLDAGIYCKKQGGHLPTAREMALFVSQPCTPQTLGKEFCGALGITEVSDFANLYPGYTNRPGYHHTKSETPDGKIDEFYFRLDDWPFDGYKKPQGELGKWGFWLSTKHPTYYYLFGAFQGWSGFLDMMIDGEQHPDRSYKAAVRCVSDSNL